MPYLTPETLPEERDCRALSIPASSEWLAIVSGALTELEKSWNWEQRGSVTVDQAVQAMRAMITAYYDGCAACTLPDGGRVIRIARNGHVEELNGDGEWGEPTGDYAIPPIPAREGGTVQDQKCLAAANAANVLEQFYEELTDLFAGSISEAEAITDFIAFIITLIGAEFAPIAFAIAAFFLGVFHLLYDALSYLTADLWTSDFTENLKCILIDCASDDAGVVTFDWDCFTAALNAQTNRTGLSETQLRLEGQILFMLQFIGGVDALNAAGATTAITTADCSGCTGCFEYLFTPGEPLFDHIFTGFYQPEDSYAGRFDQVCVGADGGLSVAVPSTGNGMLCLWTRIEVLLWESGCDPSSPATYSVYGGNTVDPTDLDMTLLFTGTIGVTSEPAWVGFDLPGTDGYYYVRVSLDSLGVCGCGGGHWEGYKILSGNLSDAGLEPNC